MGQKINPTGFRLSISRNWSSRWYASNKDFAGMLAEDIKVREYLKAKLKNAAVSRVLIERPGGLHVFPWSFLTFSQLFYQPGDH